MKKNNTNHDKKLAWLITPYPLSKEEENLFYKYLPWLKDYQIINKIDPNLVGGFIIKIGSQVLDLSLLGKIKNLTKNLL